jgi:hypothetical protein
MSFTYTCCYYVMDESTGGSEWEDSPFETFSECLTHVLKVLKNPENYEDPEGTTIPGGMCDSEGSHDWWSSSQLRLERGLYVCNDENRSFRRSSDHEQLVPLPLEKGDDGSAYGWPEQIVRQDRWTVVVHHTGNDYYANHGGYSSLGLGAFQVHARQKSEEDPTAQWYLISAFAPGAGSFRNDPAALVEGPLCIKGDPALYEESRQASMAYSRKYSQY